MIDTIRDANVRKLDLGTLIALQKLLTDRNLSQVARAMNLSQPAMSHALARLRRVFNDPLLVREGAGMVLTRRGEELRDQLTHALAELAPVFSEPEFDARRSDMTFRIAITDHAGQVLMPAILERLCEEAPRVRTVIAMIPNRQTDLALLDDGLYDLRIGWLRSLPPNWHRRKLLDDEIVLIGAINHPAFDAPMTIESFVELDHIGLESDKPIYPNLVDSYLQSLGLQRKVITRVSHFAIVPELVGSTRMVAMFPRRLAESYARRGIVRIIRPPVEFPTHDLSMGWHARVHAAREHVWLRQLIAGVARSTASGEVPWN